MSTNAPLSYLFDLDGTLVDSLRDLADATNAALDAHGYPTHPLEPYHYFLGDGAKALIKRALPANDSTHPEIVENMVLAMKSEYAQRWRRHTVPYPGIEALLENLQRRGSRCGILSNKPDEFAKEMVKALFPGYPFQPVRGARVGFPVKPDPTSALEICRNWKTSADRIVYVGDTDTDMKTGKAAGFITVGVTWGFRDKAELESAGADHIITTPMELLSL